jgi:hypothetical protein
VATLCCVLLCSMRLLQNTSRGIGDLILIYKRMTGLAGHTSRVAELLEQVSSPRLSQYSTVRYSTVRRVLFAHDGDEGGPAAGERPSSISSWEASRHAMPTPYKGHRTVSYSVHINIPATTILSPAALVLDWG